MTKQKEDKSLHKQSISKFVGHRPKGRQQKREKNSFTFTGFYDRLKSVDVKQAHTM